MKKSSGKHRKPRGVVIKRLAIIGPKGERVSIHNAICYRWYTGKGELREIYGDVNSINTVAYALSHGLAAVRFVVEVTDALLRHSKGMTENK